MHSKPTITTKCVANSYSGDSETIAEFSSAAGGGLISVRYQPAHDQTVVSVYRTDEKVKVLTDQDIKAAVTGAVSSSTNLALATALIKEHSACVGVDKQPPATQLWHVLASLVEWCEAQEPSVDIEVELGQVFEFRRDNA